VLGIAEHLPIVAFREGRASRRGRQIARWILQFLTQTLLEPINACRIDGEERALDAQFRKVVDMTDDLNGQLQATAKVGP
jgi:hypothetical protein